MFLIKSDFKPIIQQAQFNSLEQISMNPSEFNQLKIKEQNNIYGNILYQKVCEIINDHKNNKIAQKITGLIIDQSDTLNIDLVQLIENEEQLKVFVQMLRDYIFNLRTDLLDLIEKAEYSKRLKTQFKEWIHKMETLDDLCKNKVNSMKEQEIKLLQEIKLEKKHLKKNNISKNGFLEQMEFFGGNVESMGGVFGNMKNSFQKFYNDESQKFGGEEEKKKFKKKFPGFDSLEADKLMPPSRIFNKIDDNKSVTKKMKLNFQNKMQSDKDDIMKQTYIQEMSNFMKMEMGMDSENFDEMNDNSLDESDIRNAISHTWVKKLNKTEKNYNLGRQQVDHMDINYLREQGEVFNQIDEDLKFVVLEKIMQGKISKIIQQLNIDITYQMVVDFIKETGEFMAEDIVAFYDSEEELIQLIEEAACNVNSEEVVGQIF